jgi:hypothetical protein
VRADDKLSRDPLSHEANLGDRGYGNFFVDDGDSLWSDRRPLLRDGGLVMVAVV